MSSCFRCGGEAVFDSGRPSCRRHFLGLFESRVKRTIRQFGMFERKNKLAVASSGGKDSTVVLYILKKLGFDVEALAVDEGIHGYRDSTLADLREFCSEHRINLNVVSYRDFFGFSLDELLRKKSFHPCMACGILRRYVLNRASRGYDRLVTGHNLDDEAQSIMMNVIKSNVHLMGRLGPVSGLLPDSKFTPRVKPLYFCSEQEVASYAFLKGFSIKFVECPNAAQSFRASVRDMLNELESRCHGSKLGVVNSFVKMLPFLRKMPVVRELAYCSGCGEPSGKSVCAACSIASGMVAENRII
ncbi:TIGR00269 family protein [Candidatus Woesearchaeota archaeon]|nr:TIGR00269 family protein [Candidatus Woesearchaeota archaeon]